MSTPSLLVTDLSKTYGSVHALINISLQCVPGEIHAVLGENGAGKSTLVGILAGFVHPDQGGVQVAGSAMELGEPFKAKNLGIGMVHQHFTLVPSFTVAENLALAALPHLYASADPHRLSRRAAELADELGWKLDLRARTSSLSVGARQRLEILKVLSADPQIIIFDEPTAVLSKEEVADFFRVLRALREQRKTVILIAHKLSEIIEISDRVTVLRKGRLVATALTGEVNESTLAGWMVGDIPALETKSPRAAGQPVVRAQAICVKGERGENAVSNVSLEVCAGEIVGIGGVDGNGQIELAEALAGVRSIENGTLTWQGMPTPGDVAVGYIPQDRQTEGLALTMSVQDNLLVACHRLPALCRGPFLRLRAIREWAKAVIERFSIAVSNAASPVGALSGGNQQKVVVGRALAINPPLLVAVNPTRGLDVRAAAFVQDQLLAARSAGAAVALFSSDRDELALLSDRSLVMSSGAFVEAGASS
jgi:ABC-type uncharacterized transport system ATPase subunit